MPDLLGAAYPLIRPVLFRMDAERAHEWTIRAVARVPRALCALVASPPPEALCFDAFGLHFRSPVGLAAGLDKDGVAIQFWPALGFGFVEVGTVTHHAQPGNPRPRLFRLVEDRALVNRMGFNNLGSAALATRLRGLRETGRWPAVPVGVNVGKSKVTPIEEAVSDYVASIEQLQGLADYLTVNVSSPNTPGLRALQERAYLERLLPAVVQAARGTPVLLKLAPDLEEDPLAEAVKVAVEAGIEGLIATNTTIRRDGLRNDPQQEGGLSGAPLWPLARERIRTALAVSAGRLPVVGVGGIDSADKVRELMDAGCVAVQLYTSLIYEGPGLVARLNREIAR